MKHYALIETTTALVVNVLIWDGITPYEAPVGHFLHELTEFDDKGRPLVKIGYAWDGTQVVIPPTIDPDAGESIDITAARIKLTRFQLRSELIARGRNAAYIKGLVDSLSDNATRDQLYVDLEDKKDFAWDDPLIVLLRANMGGTAAAQAAVWIAASSRSA